MYCNNCGKEVSDSNAFCIYCGAKLDSIPSARSSGNNGFGKINVSGYIGFIPLILMAIWGIMFLCKAISGYESNADAFEFISDSAVRNFGVFLHWIIPAAALMTCTECIELFIKRGMDADILISNGIGVFVVGVALEVGKRIYDEIDFDDIPIVMTRIFGTYGSLVGMTLFVGIVLFAVGIGLKTARRKQNDLRGISR